MALAVDVIHGCRLSNQICHQLQPKKTKKAPKVYNIEALFTHLSSSFLLQTLGSTVSVNNIDANNLAKLKPCKIFIFYSKISLLENWLVIG